MPFPASLGGYFFYSLSRLLLCLFAFSLLLPRSSYTHAQSETDGPCQVLDTETCADNCVAFDDGTPFKCGTWSTKQQCCNGSFAWTPDTRIFFRCYCEDDGLTNDAIGLIVGMSLLGALGIAAAIGYICYRHRYRKKYEQQQYELAKQEARDFLPR